MKAREIGRRLRDAGRRGRAGEPEGPAPVGVQRAMALDGAHLWITLLAPGPGRVVAVAETGDRTAFSEPVTAAGWRTVVLDLAELPGTEDRTFRLLLEREGTAHPLGLEQPHDRPTRAPISPDGRWLYRILANGAPTLRLRRTAAPRSHPVVHLAEADGLVEVGWRGPAAGELVLLDEDGQEVAAVPATDLGGTPGARLGVDLPVPADVVLSAVVRSADGVAPLVRARDDLRRPNASVILPEVETDHGSLALRWAAVGELRVVRQQPS